MTEILPVECHWPLMAVHNNSGDKRKMLSSNRESAAFPLRPDAERHRASARDYRVKKRWVNPHGRQCTARKAAD